MKVTSVTAGAFKIAGEMDCCAARIRAIEDNQGWVSDLPPDR